MSSEDIEKEIEKTKKEIQDEEKKLQLLLNY